MSESILRTVLVMYLTVSVNSWQNGDVRLNLEGDEIRNQGVLEIYYDTTVVTNIWATVCSINIRAADAACRQLGYCDAIGFRPATNFEPSSSYYLPNVQCPVVFHYQHEELHLLRCSHSSIVQSAAKMCDGVFVECKSDCLIKDIQYEGQVYIQTEEGQPPSGTGTLQIYLDNEYLPVCYNGVTQQIANSACRTVGYTNSLPANRVLEKATSWNISTGLCINNSYDCLTDCFDNSKSYTKDICYYYSIKCTYNESIAGFESSGSPFMCSLDNSTCSNQSKETLKTFQALFSVAVSLLFIVSLAFCISCIWMCKKFNDKRRNYRPIGVLLQQ